MRATQFWQAIIKAWNFYTVYIWYKIIDEDFWLIVELSRQPHIKY